MQKTEMNSLHHQHEIPNDYVERTYAGWLGKVIGVRHGGNIEQWTYERINRTFGEIKTYLHQFKNFAADDDTNGPMFFLRALGDFTHTSEITPEQIGLTWLNYAPDSHGFYWWGGYGKSTENTAYLNLKNGIMAPRSGSIEQNGAAVAEQIGGQIFIDVWGLIAPGNPELAAEYAEKAASVSHDGNGKYGGMFIAACIAQAFVESDIQKIIATGLSVIPSDCEYRKMTNDVIDFYKKNPENWRDCFKYVFENYGYDRYPGACHIIPNSAVIVLSLLYSEGDFSKAINICNMCGWDTDCNVANVGTIMGVKNGLDGIEEEWRKPINDFLCCSSVIGSLNALEQPWCASYIARLGYKIAETEIPSQWKDILEETGPRFHFEYPGSTHAFRTDTSDDSTHITAVVSNSTDEAASGNGSLKVFFDRATAGIGYRVYYKTYYRPEDFNDSRYDPSFSPQLYPGQTIIGKVKVPRVNGRKIQARLYIKDCNKNKPYFGDQIELEFDQWTELTYPIPEMNGVCIEEAGVEFIPTAGYHSNVIAYLDDFNFIGNANYTIDFKKERIEKWNGLHNEVSQTTYLRGIWTLEDGELSGSYHGEPAECYTGDLKWKNYSFKAIVKPKLGDFHNIQFRVQGGIRSYAVGLSAENKITLFKNQNGYRELVSRDFNWDLDKEYEVEVNAIDNQFTIFVDGLKMMTYQDTDSPYLTGQVGFSNFKGSHTHYKEFTVNVF